MEAPSQSPYYYLQLARASYEKKILDFEPTISPPTEVLDYLKVKSEGGKWICHVFKNKVSGELTAVFRGTNWMKKGRSLPKEQIEAIESQIRNWNNALDKRKITTYVDSVGGFYATNVNKRDRNIFRITFNGFKCKTGKRNWNLQAIPGQDSSSRIVIVAGKSDRIFDSGSIRNGLNDFNGYLNEQVDWQEVEKLIEKFNSSNSERCYNSIEWSTIGEQLFKMPQLKETTSKLEKKEKEKEKEKERNEEEESLLDVTHCLDVTYCFDNEVFTRFYQLLGDCSNSKFSEMKKDIINIDFKGYKETFKQKPVRLGIKLFDNLASVLDRYAKETEIFLYENLAQKLFLLSKQGLNLYNSIEFFTTQKREKGRERAISALGPKNLAAILQNGFVMIQEGYECYQIYQSIFKAGGGKEVFKKAVNDIKKYVIDFVDQLDKEISLYGKEQDINYHVLQDEINVVRQDIRKVLSKIQELQSSIETKLERKESQKIQDFIIKIETAHLEFKKKKSVLTLSDPLLAKYEYFLPQFKNHLEDLSGSLLNGLENYANHREIVEAPQYFTGLLAKWIHLSNIPNYYLLTKAVLLLLEALNNNEDSKIFLKEAILEASEAAHRLLALMENDAKVFLQKVVEAQIELSDFINHYPQQREEFYKTPPQMDLLLKDSWEKTKKIREEMLEKDLIGQSKFFLSHLLAEIPNLEGNGQSLVEYCKEKYNKEMKTNEGWGVEKRNYQRLKEIGIGWEYKKFRCLANYTSLDEDFPDWAKRFCWTNELEKFWHGRLKTNIMSIFQQNIDSSLSFVEHTGTYGNLLPNEPYLFRCDIHYDVCMNKETGRPFECRTNYPGSMINKIALANIPDISSMSIQLEEYDSLIKNQMIAYFRAVQERIDGLNLFSSSNISQEHSTLISSENPQLIPLAFPNKILSYWTEKLLLKDSKLGYVIQKYDFKMIPDRKNYQLSLNFSFVSKGLSRSYASVVFAEFDELTVNSFRKVTMNKGKINFSPPNINEFLLQAMAYPSYRFSFIGGLPGKASYRLENGMVAPREVLFDGLFLLLERYPDSMLKFNSVEYTFDIRENLKRLIEDKSGDEDSFSAKHIKSSSKDLIKEKWLPPAIVNVGDKYLEVIPLLKNQLLTKDNFQPILEQKEEDEDLKLLKEKYAEAYDMLLAYCRLVSNRNESELRLLMWEALDLPPFQIVEKWKRGAFQRNEEKFQRMLRADPSENYLVLKQYLMELESFI